MNSDKLSLLGSNLKTPECGTGTRNHEKYSKEVLGGYTLIPIRKEIRYTLCK